ncbi:MAG: ABC transporter substrate-binding protein [Candidatus Kariarchaeaceae archaeon]|jgi:peptide/nickel transport system substrate-binding protein
MKAKYIIYATVFLLTLLIAQPVSVVNGADKSVGGTIETMMSTGVNTFNPIMWGQVYELHAIMHVYEFMIGVGPNREYIPVMAESWEYDTVEASIVFNLHDNMKWHDGEPITSSDIVYTMHLYRDDTGGIWDQTPASAANWTIVRNPWLAEYMINATAVTDTQVKIFFTFAPKEADMLVEIGGAWILPEHIWSQVADVTTYDPTEDGAVGSGPWVFGEWEKSQFLRFERFKNYYQDGPYAENLIINIIREIETGYYALSVGELQAIGGPMTNTVPLELENIAENDPNIAIHRYFNDYWLYIGMNQRRYPNNVKEFRQAVYYGVNRSDIVEVARFGRNKPAPASGSLDWGPYYNPDIPQYDFNPETSKTMLDALGFVDSNSDGIREDANGTKLSFDMYVSSEFDRSIVAVNMIKDYMADIGIEITPVPALFDVIWDAVGGSGLGTYDYDWSYIAWTLFWSDWHPSWAGWLYSGDGFWGGTRNLPGWEGAKADEVTALCNEISLELDDEVVQTKLDQVQAIVAEELPYLPTEIQGAVELYRTDKFEGWMMGNATGPNNIYSMKNLYLTEGGGDDDAPGFGLLAAFAGTMILAVVVRKHRK